MSLRGLGPLLGAAGVRRVFGDPVEGLPWVGVDDPTVARLLAAVDGRLHGGAGAALVGDALYVSSAPGVVPDLVSPADPGGLWLRLERARGPVPAAEHVRLRDAIVAPGAAGTVGASRRVPTSLPERVVVLAGPGVLREPGGRQRLTDACRRLGIGVLNTWGAKGLFAWDDPLHLGTAGLQARDFELGLHEAELVLAVGVDPAECEPAMPDVEAVDLAVADLELLRSPRRTPGRPPLLDELSAVCMPWYADPAVPLPPARACGELAALARERDAFVVADPGVAGFWVARTFPTPGPGVVCVPGTWAPGFAAAACALRALDGHRTIGVVHGPIDPPTRNVLAWAERQRLGVVLEQWSPGGELLDAPARRRRLETAMGAGGVQVLPLAVRAGDIEVLEAVAGKVVAWGGRGWTPVEEERDG